VRGSEPSGRLEVDRSGVVVLGLGVGALIEVALGLATTPMDASDNGDLVIKSVSAKQRPRR
jgi:hypothetical protein